MTAIADQIISTLERRGPLTRGTIKWIIGTPDSRLVTATLAHMLRTGKLYQEGKRYAVPGSHCLTPDTPNPFTAGAATYRLMREDSP
jgi:hypothetical protein